MPANQPDPTCVHTVIHRLSMIPCGARWQQVARGSRRSALADNTPQLATMYEPLPVRFHATHTWLFARQSPDMKSKRTIINTLCASDFTVHSTHASDLHYVDTTQRLCGIKREIRGQARANRADYEAVLGEIARCVAERKPRTKLNHRLHRNHPRRRILVKKVRQQAV